MKIAFSTVSSPDWTLEECISQASELGYLGLEMRSFQEKKNEEQFTVHSDPIGQDASDVAHMFSDAGVVPLALATSVKYDKAVNPPVIGRMFINEEEGVSDTKEYVDFAAQSGVRFVRVFGSHLPAAEPRTWSMRRVTERLKLAAQTCRNTDVRLLIENAGSFARSEDLLDLIDQVDSQWLGASYNILAAVNAGECPIEGVKTLASCLQTIRVCDIDSDGNPVRLGDGVFPLDKLIATLVEIGYTGWIVYEYPSLWSQGVGQDDVDAEQTLKHAASTLYDWIKGAAVNS
jgi:sugar phosphate isomerase/epimerase